MIGKTLAHYRVTDKLGAGGMGEVWRAEDTKLGRQVALKMLPPALARDPERLARFQREAQVLASLNHPNVAAIHGLEDADGERFLVLELVEGETLAERLARGALPVEEALPLACQIAQGMEAAHRQGVIHRDLKPANVKVTDDRILKVLDFGLAKATEGPTSSSGSVTPSEADASPTLSPSLSNPITGELTGANVVLGTAAYMSPEQARGRTVDRRTDIWSFGVILFECLSGQRLFAGESAAESMGAILHRDPDWDALPADTPPTIRLLLRRCLTKDLERRLHDIADARVELEDAISDPSGSALGLATESLGAPDGPSARPRRKPSLAAIAIAAFAGAALVAALAWSLRPVDEPGLVRRFEFATDDVPRKPAVSPDGRRVAYAVGSIAYIRDLDAVQPRKVWETNDRSVKELFWSPDGAHLGLVVGNEILRLPSSGGTATSIASAKGADEVGWGGDGYVYFNDVIERCVSRVPERGGEIQVVAMHRENEIHFHGGGVLPDGRGVLCVPHEAGRAATTIALVGVGQERREIIAFDHEIDAPQYCELGFILYTQYAAPAGTWAVPFSLDRLEVTGEPFLVLGNVSAVSSNRQGDLVYSRRDWVLSAKSQLMWMERDGQFSGNVGPAFYGASGFTISPDGRRVAISATGIDITPTESSQDIWIVDIDRDHATRLAAEDGMQSFITWTADSRRIRYGTILNTLDLSSHERAADGTGEARLLSEDGSFPSFSPDERLMALVVGSMDTDIWIVLEEVDDPSTRRILQQGDDWDVFPRISPRGDLFAYTGGEVLMEKGKIYVRRFPEGTGRWQISTENAHQYVWHASGDRLAYLTDGVAEQRIREVSISRDGHAVTIGEPVDWIQADAKSFLDIGYAPDGDRLLVLKQLGADETAKVPEGIVVIQNWIEEFQDRP